MRLLGGLIARYPALYDVLDAVIDYGQQRWPSVWRTVEPSPMGDDDLRAQRPAA